MSHTNVLAISNERERFVFLYDDSQESFDKLRDIIIEHAREGTFSAATAMFLYDLMVERRAKYLESIDAGKEAS